MTFAYLAPISQKAIHAKKGISDASLAATLPDDRRLSHQQQRTNKSYVVDQN